MPNRVFYLPLFVVLIAILSFRPANKEWKSFQPANGNFVVMMPGEPELKEKIVNSVLGEIKLTMYMYQPPSGSDDNVAYAVSYMDCPADKITSDSVSLIKDFFDNSRDGSLKAIQGKLLTEEIIKYKNFPGREQRVDFRNGMAVIKLRHYLVNNRLYSLQVITPTDNNFNKSINKLTATTR